MRYYYCSPLHMQVPLLHRVPRTTEPLIYHNVCPQWSTMPRTTLVSGMARATPPGVLTPGDLWIVSTQTPTGRTASSPVCLAQDMSSKILWLQRFWAWLLKLEQVNSGLNLWQSMCVCYLRSITLLSKKNNSYSVILLKTTVNCQILPTGAWYM